MFLNVDPTQDTFASDRMLKWPNSCATRKARRSIRLQNIHVRLVENL
jgi:hypothetical protein